MESSSRGRGRPRQDVVLSAEERAELERWARRPTTANALASRARIVLGCAAGGTDVAVAEALGTNRNTVGKWRQRYLANGLDGLVDEPRPGRPRTISDAAVEEVIVRTLETRPKGATHWSTRSMAAQVGLSQTAVSRIWRAFGLQPHRVESWKLSKDPFFIDKVRDVGVKGANTRIGSGARLVGVDPDAVRAPLVPLCQRRIVSGRTNKLPRR